MNTGRFLAAGGRMLLGMPPGQYELHVRVRGIKIDITFKFRLVNPGAAGNPTLEPI